MLALFFENRRPDMDFFETINSKIGIKLKVLDFEFLPFLKLNLILTALF